MEYEKYENLIYKLSWRYARIGFEFDDLLSEANWAYMRATETFDPEKCKFCTHLYNTVNGWLFNFTKPSIDNSTYSGDDCDNFSKENYNQLKRVMLKNQFEKSDSDVTIIINLIFDMPDRLYMTCLEVTCPKLTRRRLLRYLTDQMDWTPKRANLALLTIQNIVRGE